MTFQNKIMQTGLDMFFKDPNTLHALNNIESEFDINGLNESEDIKVELISHFNEYNETYKLKLKAEFCRQYMEEIATVEKLTINDCEYSWNMNKDEIHNYDDVDEIIEQVKRM
jgi:hypothetical protein